MSRIDDPPIAALPLSDRVLPTLSEPNQETFLRLQLSLSLNLRRQVFLAVCDDLALRNVLAARLASDLAQSTPTLVVLPAVNDQTQTVVVNAPPAPGTTGVLPHRSPLVSLDLDFANPNPIAQITQWVKHATTTQHLRNGDSWPSFQLLGVEGLTRKSAGIQKRFLDHLQHLGQNPTGLDSSLILWLTRPWFRMVQSSAPALWQAHTALFQFEGDPTPAPSDLVPPAIRSSHLVSGHPGSVPAAKGTPRRALWELLADDLEQFDEPIQAAALEEFDEPLLHVDNAADRVLDVAPILLSDTGFVPAVGPVLPGELVLPSEQIVAGEWVPPSEPLQLPSGDLDPLPGVVESDLSPSPEQPALEQPALEQPAPEPLVVTETRYSLPALDTDWAEQVRISIQSSAASWSPEGKTLLLQTLQEIERLHQDGAEAAAYAIAYRTLGNLYRDGIEQGNASEANLRLTIRTYELTLDWLELTAPESADVLNDMGNLYWMLARQATDSDTVQIYLDQGIAAYRLALSHIDPQVNPHGYAMLQNNLGSAYGDLARYRDPSVVLQYAVQAYAESLRYRSADQEPARYAATQNNLGTAYWNLAQYEQPTARLHQAIAAYMEALRYYNPEQEPLHYAMIQNNLGTAYWNLAQQMGLGKGQGKLSAQADPAAESPTARGLLLGAINAYRDALTYRTLAIAPTAYAATQNNLGTAFWNLAMLPDTELDVKQDALEWAISAYTDAITAIHQLTQQSQDSQLTFDRYATHNNLGLSHYHLAIGKHAPMDASTRSQHLEAALQQHLQALGGWAHQPDYAKTATSYIVQTVRAFYTHFGMKGQNIALSKIPAALLPELMRKL